jgi:outer membrane protein OmpA-like peptidoglycan-associated protein
MPRFLPAALLLAAPVLGTTPLAAQDRAPIVFEGNGQFRTIDCAGRDAVVRGERNDLTFVGGCRSLTVEGNASRIRAALAPNARVVLRGEVLDLAWSQADAGEAPRFATEGRQIRVERSAEPIGVAANRAARRENTARGVTLNLSGDVLFGFGQDRLGPNAAQGLDEVATLIRQMRPRSMTIVGHTDSVGDEATNRDLSLRRARAVQRWLEERAGDAMPAVVVDGRGEADPIAPNARTDGRDDPDGRAQNRRVEITLER